MEAIQVAYESLAGRRRGEAGECSRAAWMVDALSEDELGAHGRCPCDGTS